jgi:hypothetical protein
MSEHSWEEKDNEEGDKIISVRDKVHGRNADG